MPDLCHLTLTGTVTNVFEPYQTTNGNYLHTIIVDSKRPAGKFSENGVTLSSRFTVKLFHKDKDIDVLPGDNFQCTGRMDYGIRKDEKNGKIYPTAIITIANNNDWSAIAGLEEVTEDTNVGKTNTKENLDSKYEDGNSTPKKSAPGKKAPKQTRYDDGENQ